MNALLYKILNSEFLEHTSLPDEGWGRTITVALCGLHGLVMALAGVEVGVRPGSPCHCPLWLLARVSNGRCPTKKCNLDKSMEVKYL